MASAPELIDDDSDSDDGLPTHTHGERAQPFSKFRCIAKPVLASNPQRCHPYATLSVNLIQAAELDPSLNEIADTTDPYAVIYVDDNFIPRGHGSTHFERKGDDSCRTETVTNTTAPKWNASFCDIPITSPLSIFTIRVFDADTVTEDDPIGFLDIRVGALPLNQEVEDWFQLYKSTDDQDGDTVKCRLTQCSSIEHPDYAGWINISLKLTVQAELDVLFAYMLSPPYQGHGLQSLRLERMLQISMDFNKKQRKIKRQVMPLYEFVYTCRTASCGLTIAAMWIPNAWTPFCVICTFLAGLYVDLAKPDANDNRVKSFAAKQSEILGFGRSKSTARFAEQSKKGIQTIALKSMNPLMPKGPRHALRTMQRMMEVTKKISDRVQNRVDSAFRTISLPLILIQIILHFGWPYLFILLKVALSVVLVYFSVIGRVLRGIWMYVSHKRIRIEPDTEKRALVLRAESSVRLGSPRDRRSSPQTAKVSPQPHHLGQGLRAQLLVASSEAVKESDGWTAHDLQPLSFYSMTWCRVCAGMVVGLASHGVECRRCEMVVCGRDSCKRLVKQLNDCRGEAQPSPYFCNPHTKCWAPHRYCMAPQALEPSETL